MRKTKIHRPSAPLRPGNLSPGRFSLLLACALQVFCTSLQAQPTFGPPPQPNFKAPTVRGIYDPTQAPTSPAWVPGALQRPAENPGPTSPPAIGTTIPATPPPATSSPATTSDNARPLEGGQIVARIESEIVLASDVLWQVDQMIAANQERIPPGEMEKVRNMLLRQQVMALVDTKLLYADFRRTVPAENMPQIEGNLVQPFEENEVPRLIKALEVNDRRELAQVFSESGTSLKDIQRQFNERTIAGEWLRQKTPKPKSVTREEMLQYYQENPEQYKFPAQARWEELAIRFDRVGNDRNAAWKAIAELGNEAWTRATAAPGVRGPIFAALAKEKSHGFTAQEGGVHDWTSTGAMRCEELNESLFDLKIGQLSNIIESEQGFHIVRVLERKEAGCTPFTETQTEIRDLLKKDRKSDLLRAELDKLRRKSRVWTVFDGPISGERIAEGLQQKKRL